MRNSTNPGHRTPGVFPKDFLWGASTSSHQVEGNTHNQWTIWEYDNATQLASTAITRLGWLPNWPSIARDAQDPANYLSDNGIEHYERYEDDFDLLKDLHMNAYRFGIEWSRIEPEQGKWDESAIRHYERYILALKKRGIVPIPTLWHWTVPVWFEQLGGFADRRNLAYFERYVQKIAPLIGKKTSYVITLNEPNVYAGQSFASGDWPPQKKNVLLALRVYANLVTAHRIAYTILKRAEPGLQIGIAAHLSDMRPVARNPFNKLTILLQSYAWNWWFINRISGHHDFIGVNYYFTEYRDWRGRIRNPATPVSDLGWYMEPAGIEQVLVQAWARYRKPIIITENGLADSNDTHRKWWLEQTLSAMENAMRRGVRLHGYLHWSLLDNFEWAYGWWPRFGLVRVNHTTMQRTIRPSALWLANSIRKIRQR